MSPTGIDQSWGYADPTAAAHAGVQVVSMYLSYDPSKNITAAKVKAYHRAGVAVMANWESDAGAPLNGAARGKADASEAMRQLRALIGNVGYHPGNRLITYFSCDRDVNSSQYPVIDAYYRGAGDVCHAAGCGVGCYGEADLVHHLSAAGITDGEWQTLAWSGGRIDPAADFYQSSINNTVGGASVDFDQVIHPSQLGAWWPPGSTYDNGGLTVSDVSAIRSDIASLREHLNGWMGVAIHGDKTHPNSQDAAGKAIATLLTRVAALQSAQAAQAKQITQLQADITALQAHGAVKVDPATLPVTGTVTINGGTP